MNRELLQLSIDVTDASIAAMVNLGACDDPECPNCGHALPDARTLLDALKSELAKGCKSCKTQMSFEVCLSCFRYEHLVDNWKGVSK